MIDLLIISSSDHMLTQGPNGFVIADQILKEASLKDPISTEQRSSLSLEKTLGLLIRRYPGRIRVRWIDPWSPGGLLVCIRYRVRTFPAVIINQTTILVGSQLERDSLREILENALSNPAGGE
jgi:hypothetical protein